MSLAHLVRCEVIVNDLDISVFLGSEDKVLYSYLWLYVVECTHRPLTVAFEEALGIFIGLLYYCPLFTYVEHAEEPYKVLIVHDRPRLFLHIRFILNVDFIAQDLVVEFNMNLLDFHCGRIAFG